MVASVDNKYQKDKTEKLCLKCAPLKAVANDLNKKQICFTNNFNKSTESYLYIISYIIY